MLYVLQFRFAAFILLTGIFSAFFHATLWLVGQRLDEIFENAILIAMFHSIGIPSSSGSGSGTATGVSFSTASRATMGVHFVACALGIVFVTFFLFTEIHLIGMASVSVTVTMVVVVGKAAGLAHDNYSTDSLSFLWFW